MSRLSRHLSLVGLLAVTGCAFTPEVVLLNSVSHLPQTVTGARAVVVELRVEDLRADPTDVIARKVNGWGHQAAEITSEKPVKDMLSQSLAIGLEMRGYRLAADGPIALTVELLVFSHEFRTGMWSGRSEATVTFLATVRDRAGRELYREVIAEAFSHPVQLANGANVKKAYETATMQAVERLLDSKALQRALALAASPPVL